MRLVSLLLFGLFAFPIWNSEGGGQFQIKFTQKFSPADVVAGENNWEVPAILGSSEAALLEIEGPKQERVEIQYPRTIPFRKGSVEFSAQTLAGCDASTGGSSQLATCTVQIPNSGKITVPFGAKASIPVTLPSGIYQLHERVSARLISSGKVESDNILGNVKIIAGLGARTTKDLAFSDAFPGDDIEQVPPFTTNSASVEVRGEPGYSIRVLTPTASTVAYLVHSTAQDADSAPSEKKVRVHSFSHGANGETNKPSYRLGESSGRLELSLGATRDRLLSNQVSGQYSGSITVTVSY